MGLGKLCRRDASTLSQVTGIFVVQCTLSRMIWHSAERGCGAASPHVTPQRDDQLYLVYPLLASSWCWLNAWERRQVCSARFSQPPADFRDQLQESLQIWKTAFYSGVFELRPACKSPIFGKRKAEVSQATRRLGTCSGHWGAKCFWQMSELFLADLQFAVWDCVTHPIKAHHPLNKELL